ncbi:MAG: aminotransferase class I/II-fold pyridoxal phosphate-dependent enzyme [Pseudomonadota bacterium]
MVKINPTIEKLSSAAPFIAPEETERQRGVIFKARLGANEGNFGPSPAALEAMAKATQDSAWKYGDPTGHDLRATLADSLGVPFEGVVLGTGIDNLLGLTVRIFSERGDKIVTSLGAYPTFNYHVTGNGRVLSTVPYADFHEDLDGLLKRVQDVRPPIVYLSNPDNPMGTWWPAEKVEAFAAALPSTTLFILDEAYSETAPSDAIPAIGNLPENVIRMRTFSKAYGLAGMRCGYAIGEPPLISQFNKIRDHFGVTSASQAGAMAAFSDQEYLRASIAKIELARSRIATIASDNGLTPIESASNFVACVCEEGPQYANALISALAEEGVFIRKSMAPGLDHCIRVSVGRDEELDWFETALPRAIETAALSTAT